MNDYNIIKSCKNIIINNYIIIIIMLFVIVYISCNYNIIITTNILNGNFSKSIIITGIIFLITYLFITWEDIELNNNSDEEIIIPKYKILNKNINLLDKNIELKGNLNTKYNTTNENLNLDLNEKINNNNELYNNIFISHKNKSKFGIKF